MGDNEAKSLRKPIIRFVPATEYDASFSKKILTLGIMYSEDDSAGHLKARIPVKNIVEALGISESDFLKRIEELFDRTAQGATIFDWQCDLKNPESDNIEAHMVVTKAVCDGNEVQITFNDSAVDTVVTWKNNYSDQFCMELMRLNADCSVRLYELLELEYACNGQNKCMIDYNAAKLKLDLSIINSGGSKELSEEIRKDNPSYERIEELALMTGQDKYANYEDFKRDFLDVAVDEINEKTSLMVDYSMISTYKKATTVRFAMNQK